MTRPLIAIDPGKSGALAFCDAQGRVWAERMPDTLTDLRDLLVEYDEYHVVMERKDGILPGKGVASVMQFVRHCGAIEGVVVCLGMSSEDVSPHKWMRWLIGSDKGKHAIKAKVQRMFPHLKVINDTADALGILAWAMGRDEGR